jgi:hypothetical protein
MRRAALREVQNDRLDALVDRRLPGQPELEEDGMDHLLDGLLGQDEGVRDRGVVLPLCHLSEHVSLTRRQLLERRVLAPRILCDERLDDLRVEDRAADRDGPDRADELVEIVHALLQEIRAALASPFEESEKIARVRVLAEHDHAHLGMRLTQSRCGLDPLVVVPRRHPDVRDDDVGPLRVDRCEERGEVAAHGRDLEAVLTLEQTAEALTDQVLVLGKHDADRHRLRIRC